jgi:transcriptional regulator with XRE-family HTH domain
MATFADRLRELRGKAGLSQAELANRAGLHRFGISKLELGLREPTWATVQALALALGVDCTAFADTRQRDTSDSTSPGTQPAAMPARAGSRHRKGKQSS